MRGVVFLLSLLLAAPAAAGHLHPEAWYQDRWCAAAGGQAEVVLEDRTRVDCLTRTHAIEFDFGRKWAEAHGQALHYGRMTGRRAGIVLIIEDESDMARWEGLMLDIASHSKPVDVWLIWAESYGEVEK